jgi:L-asparaginase II
VPVPLVRVIRSGLEESIHAGDVAVVDADGALVAFAGDPARRVFARSAMKPLQAAVSLSFASTEFDDDEVAVMCASHNAEPVHVQAVRSLLRRAGVDEGELQCAAVRPWDDESLAADPERRRINSDCSGKHAGMLAACHAQGWPTASYRDADHPLQKHVLRAVRFGSGQDALAVGVDGCGVPVHGLSLIGMASIYARLSVADQWSDAGLAEKVRQAITAMQTRPYLVAGRNRVDTVLMDAVPGLVVKGGAEGVICAALVDRGMGLAVKVQDGASRAAGPAVIHALDALGVLHDGHRAELAEFARPPVPGGGERVGELAPAFELTPA